VQAALAAVVAVALLCVGCVRTAAKEVTRGALEELGRTSGAAIPGAEEQPREPGGRARPLLGPLVNDATRAGIVALGQQMTGLTPILRDAGEAMSSGIVQGVSGEDQTLVGLIEQGSGAAARGLIDELRTELTACPEGNERCSHAAIEGASRAMGAGFGEGIGRTLHPWLLGLAFGGGFLVAAIGAATVAVVSRRRERVQPR
jgi:hypothetical protein